MRSKREESRKVSRKSSCTSIKLHITTSPVSAHTEDEGDV